ncbi:hypothetical protein D3C75_1117270 [compost metagenome]
MSDVHFIARWVKQHGQGFRHVDLLQNVAVVGINNQHLRLLGVGNKRTVVCRIQADIQEEVFLRLIQFLT